MQNISILILAATLAACPTQPTPPAPPAPTATADAAPPPAPTADAAAEPHDACWTAAQKLIALGCKDSRGRLLGGPNLSGVTWSATCRQDLVNGVSLNPACITGAASCTAVEGCK